MVNDTHVCFINSRLFGQIFFRAKIKNLQLPFKAAVDAEPFVFRTEKFGYESRCLTHTPTENNPKSKGGLEILREIDTVLNMHLVLNT